MSDLLSDIRIGWGALAFVEDGMELCSISFFNKTSTPIRVGRLAHGLREIVLFNFGTENLPSESSLPKGKGFDISYYKVENLVYIGLSRSDDGCLSLFERMLCDVIEYLASIKTKNSSQLRNFLSRISNWQAFMSRTKSGLSRQEEIGLIGELIVLFEILTIQHNYTEVLSNWSGPVNGLHDFQFCNGAIEVKSSISNDSFSIDVFDSEQFETKDIDVLMLIGIKLVVSRNGRTLNDLVSEIRDYLSENINATEVFNDKIGYYGYNDDDSEQYNIAFKSHDIFLYNIDDEFPSIRRKDIPNEVSALSYKIDLENVKTLNSSLGEVLNILGSVYNGFK